MKKLFRRILMRNKIRGKLIFYFALTTLIMGVTSLYTYYNARMLMLKMDSMFTRDVYLNELYNNINRVEANLESYLSTKHSDNYREYSKNSTILRGKIEEIKKDAPDTESGLLLKDIGNMIDTYLNEADTAVIAKRGRDINGYINHYSEASKIVGYINLYINKLNTRQIQENTARYQVISARLNLVQMLNIGLILGAIVFNLLLILYFTYRITTPIIRLSHSADEISRGNFDIAEMDVDTEDEIHILANAFNRMTQSIRSYIDQIKEKAQLEGRLKEQEMQNLKIKNLLKETELQALQSQINPHFIFNTLNAGAQIAMLEGADKSCLFMENVANLLRYNVRKLEKPVDLSEEICSIQNYMHILKARFADRIEFILETDESITGIRMPRLILQPLVENAFIHGIGEMESGGWIALRVRRIENAAEIIIEDNGKGMEKKVIERILGGQKEAQANPEHQTQGHTTGIGMNNVLGRLRLFFGREDMVDIISSPGHGTKIVIQIPV